MTCHRLNADLIDMARGIALDAAREAEVAAHLRSCASCTALVDRQRAMSVGLSRLASEQHALEPNPSQLKSLLSAFDRPRGRSRRATLAVGFSLAASAVIVTGLSVGWRGGAPSPASRDATRPSAGMADGPFVALPGTHVLPRFEHGEVIRVEIPSPDGAIQADVLVGQDGFARAVRLVQ